MVYILLPVYNEEENLEQLLARISSQIRRQTLDFEILCYNDGSTDNSLKILNDHTNTLPLHIIGEPDNRGLGTAFRRLLKEALVRSTSDDDIIVVLDSDNSHNPGLIYRIIDRIRDGFDVVIASRYLPDSRIVGVSRFRQWLSIGASRLMQLLFPIKGVRDYTCGYRGYSVAIIRKAFAHYGDRCIIETGFACMAELLIKLRALSVLCVEIPLILRYDQKGGESKMDVSRTVRRTLRLLWRLKRGHE